MHASAGYAIAARATSLLETAEERLNLLNVDEELQFIARDIPSEEMAPSVAPGEYQLRIGFFSTQVGLPARIYWDMKPKGMAIDYPEWKRATASGVGVQVEIAKHLPKLFDLAMTKADLDLDMLSTELSQAEEAAKPYFA